LIEAPRPGPPVVLSIFSLLFPSPQVPPPYSRLSGYDRLVAAFPSPFHSPSSSPQARMPSPDSCPLIFYLYSLSWFLWILGVFATSPFERQRLFSMSHAITRERDLGLLPFLFFFPPRVPPNLRGAQFSTPPLVPNVPFLYVNPSLFPPFFRTDLILSVNFPKRSGPKIFVYRGDRGPFSTVFLFASFPLRVLDVLTWSFPLPPF